MIDVLTIYAVIGFLFGIFLYKFLRRFNKLKPNERWSIILLVFSFAAFLLFNFLSDTSKDYLFSLTFTRLAVIAPSWFAYSIYLTSIIYPISLIKYKNKKFDRILLLVNLFITLIALILLTSNYNISSFELTDTTPVFSYGPLYYIIAALSLFNVIAAIARWTKNLSYCVEHQKQQIRYTIVAIFINSLILIIAYLVLPIVGLSKYTGFSFIGLFFLIYYLMNSILIPDELVDLRDLIRNFGFILTVSLIIEIAINNLLIRIPGDVIILSLVVVFISILIIVEIAQKLRFIQTNTPLDHLSLSLANIIDQKEIFSEVRVRLNSYFRPQRIKIVEKTDIPQELLELFDEKDVLTYENMVREYPDSSTELNSFLKESPSFCIGAWDYSIIIYNSRQTLTHGISEKLQTFASDLNLALQRSVYRYSYSELSKDFDNRVASKTNNLKRENTRLIESDKKKSEFLSIASHQLRTPVSTLIGYTDGLKSGDFGQYPEALAPIVSSINQSAVYLGELVNDFLNVTKVEDGKLAIVRTKFNVRKLVEDCYFEIKDRIEGKGLKFLVNIAVPENLIIELDLLKTRQCIMNLLDNAAKYTATGYIKYESFIDGGNWVFSIEDTGIGISEEYKKRMFEKFSRAPEASKVVPDGSGIGLYLVKSIVDLQGGNLSVESEMGRGTKFTVTFKLNV